MFKWERETLKEEIARPLDDPRYNLCVPSGQSVRVPVIWVIDLFPPSYASRMQQSILRQGWKDDLPWRGFDTAQKLRAARQIGTYNSRNLVRLIAEDQPHHPLMGSVQGRLPKMFTHIDVSLIELGNSLSAVSATFQLRAEFADSIDRAMRRLAYPRTKRNRNGFSIHHREEMSRQYVADAHHALRREARRWLSGRVPGVFANEAAGRLPVLDLIVASGEANPADQLEASGMWRALGVASDFYITESRELGGIRFNEYEHPLMRQQDDHDIFSVLAEAHSVNTARGRALLGDKSASPSLAQGVMDGMALYLSRLSINSLLALKSSQSADARDAAHKLHRRRSVTSIKTLRESFLRGSLDSIAIAKAIKGIAQRKRDYHWQVIEFESSSNRRYGPDNAVATPRESHLDYLAKWQSAESDELLAQDSQTREVLGLVASLTAGIEAIRSQRWALAVASFSFFAAVFAVVLSSLPQAQTP